MVTISNKGWIKWLNTHTTRQVYDEIPEKVMKLCNGPTSAISKFEKLVQNKNLVLLTRAPLGKKCQATFFHSTVGIHITPDALHHVARLGMQYGAGVELQPDSLFSVTSEQYIPSLIDMMKVKSAEEFQDLKAPTSGTKKKIHCFAVLTPALAEAIQSTDMTPAALFLALTEQMRVLAPPVNSASPAAGTTAPPSSPTSSSSSSSTATRSATAAAATAAAETATDQVLKKIAEPYAQALKFVWAVQHLEGDVTIPTVVPLRDEATITWEKETGQIVEPKKAPVSFDLTAQKGVSNDVSQTGALTAMTKLSEAMTRYQEASAKVQDTKADTRLKAWTKLPQVQKNIILLGGVREDGTYDKEVTEEMLSILGCSNGAQVDQYLKQVMVGHNVRLEPGLCSALNKGILIHADDTTAPKHFTPFLTPPISDDEDVAENNDLLKLAVQTKYSENDVSLLTKMDVSIPMKTQELKHQVKNIAGLTARCLGSDSLLYASLKDVADHIEKREISYNYEFRQDKLFGGNFLDRIHWRMHRFFDSCAMGDAEQIDLDKLDFSDMLQQVERREYNCKAPSWIQKLIKLREKAPQDDQNSGRGGSGGGGAHGGRNKRRSFDQDNGRNQRVVNTKLSDTCKLCDGEQYRFIFHVGNIREIEKPKKKNGDMMCMRFHSLGYCFKDCRFANGHGELDADETKDMEKFLGKARVARRRFMENQRGRQGNRQRSEPTAPVDVEG